MSAQNPKPTGVFSAIAGLLGFSALAGLLVTVMVTPAIAVTGVTASSTIGIFDSLPEYIEIGRQPERNTIWAPFAHPEDPAVVDGYFPIATIYDQNREEIPYDKISAHALNAAVDGEDRRFFDHGGVDVASVIRATLGNLGAGDVESGASTLTMQLVKQIFVQDALEKDTPEARDAAYKVATKEGIDRKLREMKLAIALEKKYTKKEILAAYLNIAFFGDNTYGIEAAAQRYYSTTAANLTAAQAASLVAIVQYPGIRSLDAEENYPENQKRRDVILDAMFELGHLTQEEYDQAIETQVSVETVIPSDPKNGCVAAYSHARWFCDYVVKNIKNFPQLGNTPEERTANWEKGGYNLYTTLDLELQIVAQNQVWTYAPAEETAFALGSAAVSVQPGTGRVLTMAENKIFNDTLEGGGPATSAVNYNTNFDYGGSGGMQSGSTYKLFTLIAWLKAGNGLNEVVNGNARSEPQSKFKDSCGGPWGGPPYKFTNSGGESGSRTVDQSTINSINGSYVSMALKLDLCDIRKVAESLGVERANGQPLETNPSSILGTNYVTPISMAGAYAAIAANGVVCKPIILDRVVDPDGVELPGQTPECEQAVDPEIAATAAYSLQRVMQNGTGSASNPDDGVPILGKTGSTDDYAQTWIIASSTTVTTAVWVGTSIGEYDMRDAGYNGVGGSQLRHAIMRGILATANARYSGAEFPPPAERYMRGSGAVVPDLTGMTLQEAQGVLEAVGFAFAHGGEVDSAVAAGLVVSTDPPAQARTAKGITITVFTSKGNLVPLPDVVTGAPTFNQAKATLSSQGFKKVEEACAVTIDPALVGKVVSSSPAPGTLVSPDQEVKLGVGQIAPC